VVTFRGRLIRFLLGGANWSPLEPYRLGYQFASVAGGGYRFLDPADNRIYTFAANGFLTRIEDRNGNALTVTPGATGPAQVSDGLLADGDAQGNATVKGGQTYLAGVKERERILQIPEDRIELHLCANGLGAPFESHLSPQKKQDVTSKKGTSEYWRQVLKAKAV